jgi:ABC-type transporter Mla maintaining outer membrane lipid asymmetry permease subunit MlaE
VVRAAADRAFLPTKNLLEEVGEMMILAWKTTVSAVRPPSMVKTTLVGAIIAIVSRYKGMAASGGAEGVGQAVNQGVVIASLGIFAFNYVFTQTMLATHPEISVIK